jgi:uncharacterized phage infection (PIP) family protein YhgE
MSETALETLHKKRTELENQWSSQLQKQKTLEDNIKALEEKVQAQLQQKIKTEDQVLDTLEAKRKDLEKRLQELQEQQATSQNLEAPTPENTETTEQVQEQPMDMTVNASDATQELNEEARGSRKEDKKRKWV